MKLHDNSRLRGGLVIVRTASKLLKTKGQVQVSCRLVGLPDLQKDGTAGTAGERSPQAAGNPLPAEFRRNRKVENLAFAFHQRSGRQESGNPAGADRHQEVIVQVIGGIPVRCFRAGSLNGRDLLQIACFAAPDYWHIEYYARAAAVAFLSG